MSDINRTPDMVRASVSSIYSDLLRKRTIEREQKEEMKRVKEEEKKQRKSEEKAEKKENMTKAERRKAEIDAWKEIVVGLTGDDLEYTSEKKGKKKYKKWIDDSDTSSTVKQEVKKPKKRNYHKEFAPELNMLKALVAEQNRFSADLLKRYQNAAGPNTKDAAPPNKTIVELMSTINASRANSLGMLREIGNLKKTIADLYMKQKKLDADLHGSGKVSDLDIGLMGSDIASNIFGDRASGQSSFQTAPMPPMPSGSQQSGYTGTTQETTPHEFNSSTFDPSSWDGGPEFTAETESVIYETIPHQVVVELNESQGEARFKAIRSDNGEELVGAPLPTSDPTKLNIDKDKMRVKGQFDEIYPLILK